MTPTKQDRKAARTRIYRAVFGFGGREHNVAWTDKDRRRLQDWSQGAAFMLFEEYKHSAKLPHNALVAIASALGVELKEVL